MHAATCGECGNACEVPFKPSNDKPVFCNDCFMSKRNDRDAGHRGDNNRGERREERGTKERYISTPRENKSFDNSGNEKAISELRTMVAEMSKKIDSLIGAAATKATKVVVMDEVKVEVKAKPKKVAVKKVVAKKKTK
jgi:CxxC-x17-CxxC domain-containing protein